MGGAVIIGATLLGYVVAHADHRRAADRVRRCCVLFLMIGLGPGRLPRRLHQDLQAAQPRACAPGAKLAGQTVVAVIFAVLALQFPGRGRPAQTPAGHTISFVRDTERLRAADGRAGDLSDLADRSPAPATG